MSDFEPIPSPEADFEPLPSPEAMAIADLYFNNPAIPAHQEDIKKLYCDTGYFCCGPCDCEAPRTPAFCGTNWIPCDPIPGCTPWSSPRPPDAGPCWVDPVAQEAEKTFDKIEKINTDFYVSLYKSLGAKALELSNQRASEIVRRDIINSSEYIFAGMIKTMLEAGAIGGAIVGATQAFNSIFNAYVSDAYSFLNGVKPYSPGGRTGLS